ncbi:MAG: PH domain-containing protein [Pseudomonadota bacterium]
MNEEAGDSTYRFRPQWRYQWPSLLGIAAGVALAVLLRLATIPWLPAKLAHAVEIGGAALAVYLVLLAVFRRYSWLYTIDAESIESSHGLISRRVQSIRIRDLRNINIRQTVMQRLLDVGDVEFSSAAGGDVEVIFYGAPDPMGLKEYVQARQRTADREQGQE